MNEYWDRSGGPGGGESSGHVKKLRFPQTWSFNLCKPSLEEELQNPGLTTIRRG